MSASTAYRVRLGVVHMRVDAAAGVFVGGLVAFMAGLWLHSVLLMVVGVAVMVGTAAATARQRRQGPDPDVTLRPGGKGRPWHRHDSED